MERISAVTARSIFGNNFIGPQELEVLFSIIGVTANFEHLPDIPFDPDLLKSKASEYILILGVPVDLAGSKITIARLRDFFGMSNKNNFPCFYNQDWYLMENFIHQSVDFKWYLIRKNIIAETRALNIEDVLISNAAINLPSAILCAYTFFAWAIIRGEILWENDFVWCSDFDKNNDRVYIGKYCDILNNNRSGFSIHRHLKIRDHYGSIDFYI
jgi:hypothetical protein